MIAVQAATTASVSDLDKRVRALESLVSALKQQIAGRLPWTAVTAAVVPPPNPTPIEGDTVSYNAIADAYSYAVATDVPNPGKDEAVVTDANILAAVEAIVAPDTPE